MSNTLQELSPVKKYRQELPEKTQGQPAMSEIFKRWTGEQEEYSLDFIADAGGAKPIILFSKKKTN